MQLVHQNGDRLFVTSLDISNRFGKRHDNVCRDIENLECSQEFRRLNFEESVYHSRQNKPLKVHNITRDGFVFLCMGFTGPQAALWKERYITAFNEMEQALRANLPARQDVTLAREVGQLKDMVNAQNQVIIGLYQRIDTAQRGQIRAVTSLLSLQKRQAAADAKALVLELDAIGVSRDEIARRTGKTLNHVRQIIFQHRRDNPESPQGELGLGVAA